jgi:bifunctional non-homologous end joining protein LigD
MRLLRARRHPRNHEASNTRRRFIPRVEQREQENLRHIAPTDLRASWQSAATAYTKSGDRSGAWVKVRANRGQELVIGGYIPGSTTFDSILVGYYEGGDLMYTGRIRNGFTPASRRTLLSNFRGSDDLQLSVSESSRVRKGQMGEGLTVEDMKKYRWLKPQLGAAIEFLGWTADAHLRHPKFVALRYDRIGREVKRQQE